MSALAKPQVSIKQPNELIIDGIKVPKNYLPALEKVNTKVRVLLGFGDGLFDNHVFYIGKDGNSWLSEVYVDQRGQYDERVPVISRMLRMNDPTIHIPNDVRRRLTELTAVN